MFSEFQLLIVLIKSIVNKKVKKQVLFNLLSYYECYCTVINICALIIQLQIQNLKFLYTFKENNISDIFLDIFIFYDVYVIFLKSYQAM